MFWSFYFNRGFKIIVHVLLVLVINHHVYCSYNQISYEYLYIRFFSSRNNIMWVYLSSNIFSYNINKFCFRLCGENVEKTERACRGNNQKWKWRQLGFITITKLGLCIDTVKHCHCIPVYYCCLYCNYMYISKIITSCIPALFLYYIKTHACTFALKSHLVKMYKSKKYWRNAV